MLTDTGRQERYIHVWTRIIKTNATGASGATVSLNGSHLDSMHVALAAPDKMLKAYSNHAQTMLPILLEIKHEAFSYIL